MSTETPVRESSNIEKLLDFTGEARSDKAQVTEVTLKYADKEIKVALTYAEVGFLMRGLYEAAIEVQKTAHIQS